MLFIIGLKSFKFSIVEKSYETCLHNTYSYIKIIYNQVNEDKV